MPERKVQNPVLVHAIPVSYKKGGRTSKTKLAQAFNVFSRSVDCVDKRVDPSLFINIDEDGNPHIIDRKGNTGKSFTKIDDAVTYLSSYLKNIGQNIGFVVGCYETKQGWLNSADTLKGFRSQNLASFFNISGGVLPQELHDEFLNLFYRFYYGPYVDFCKATGTMVNRPIRESVENAKGAAYFEQAFLQESTRGLNQMKFKVVGSEHYESARFFRPGEDPVSKLKDFLDCMDNGCNVLPTTPKEAEKIYYGLLKVYKTLQSYQPHIKNVLKKLSLRRVPIKNIPLTTG